MAQSMGVGTLQVGGGTSFLRAARSRPTIAALVFLSYLIPSFIAGWRVWTTHPTSIGPGGPAADATQDEWYMRWFPWAIAHGHDPLVSHWINVPFGINLVDNTSTPLLAVLAIPVTEIWGPVAAVNVWWLLAFPLSGCGAYLLARRFTTWRPAAWLAGLLYAFSPYMVGQGLGHLMLIVVPLPPLIFVVLHDLFIRQEWSWVRSGLLLALLVILQFFISTEVLATTALFAAIGMVVVAIWRRRDVPARLRHALYGLAVAAVIVLVVVAYPLYLAIEGPSHIIGGVPGFSNYVSALFAPLLPSHNMLIAPHRLSHLVQHVGGNGAENGTYLGFPLVLVMLITPFVIRRRDLRVAVVLAVIAFILSLGPRLHTGIHHLGFINHIRLPAYFIGRIPVLNDGFPVRYSLYIVLFASIVLAITVETLHTGAVRHAHTLRVSPSARLALPALLAIVVLVPLIPRWPYDIFAPVGVPSFFRSGAVNGIPAQSVALVYPLPTNHDPQADLWQAEAGFRYRMPGGYFVVPGPGSHSVYTASTLAEQTLSALLDGLPVPRTPALRRQLRAELRAWDVQTLVVNRVGRDPIGFFTWLTGRPPDTSDTYGVAIWKRTTWA